MSVPAVVMTGRPLHWVNERKPDFVECFQHKFPDPEALILILGDGEEEEVKGGGEGVGPMWQLRQAGYTRLVEVHGG
jgi:hypothetical protein